MKFNIKDIFTNWIVKNLAAAAALVLAVILIANFLLGIGTKHGKSIEVPDFTNMSVAEAEKIADAEGLRLEVLDSVYVRRMEKGAIFTQNPKAGSAVKKGRRITLTVNAKNAQKVPMPNLKDLTIRMARTEIKAKGLNLRKITYRQDEATDLVLEQLYNGRNIAPGKMIDAGSYIDVVVGINYQEAPELTQTNVPNVVGMKYLRAVDALHDKTLNATLLFDKSVQSYSDSLDAVVYKQGREPSTVPIDKGESVSIYLTIDPEKIK